ncbi:MAG: S-layer homology domain-containing protein [Clostridia bacterium]|nr:S-layer homology domain-containing protein [Clostridia bacterium]
MKKKATQILSLLLLGTVMITGVSAAELVSPALDIIASDLDFIKTGLVNNDITFTADDFCDALGISTFDEITVTTLPSAAAGRLYLKSTPVSAGQTISRRSISSLRFRAPDNGSTSASFTFTCEDAGGYERTCMLHVIPEMNFAPTVSLVNARSLNIATYRNITSYGTLKASDPENDSMTYVITKQPKKGVIVITDKNYGDYYYTPSLNYSGGDSFEYTVYDKYGNFSETATVSISVLKPSTDVTYSDMEGHWAHNAAIKMAESGVMTGEEIGNSYVFNPDSSVTRGQFLVMAMSAAGFRIATPTVDTGFMDDDAIPSQYKGYVAAALELGFINGVENEDGLYFCPNNAITRAESAVILNNILGAEVPAVKPVFADSTGVPAWAENAIFALCEVGIMNGTGVGYISPYRTLNRAETAQMLASFMDVIG